MMKPFINITIKTFDTIALSLTLLLLGIVAFNIVARQLFDLTNNNLNLMIPGAIELSKYILLLIIFSALPHASISNMVRVDLLSNHLPKILSGLLDKLWLFLISAVFSTLFYLFANKAWLTFNRGDATQDLQIPLFYFYAFISIAAFVTALVSLLNGIFRNKHEELREQAI